MTDYVYFTQYTGNYQCVYYVWGQRSNTKVTGSLLSIKRDFTHLVPSSFFINVFMMFFAEKICNNFVTDATFRLLSK